MILQDLGERANRTSCQNRQNWATEDGADRLR